MCATMRDARGTDGEGGSGVRPLLAKSGRGEGERKRGGTPSIPKEPQRDMSGELLQTGSQRDPVSN